MGEPDTTSRETPFGSEAEFRVALDTVIAAATHEIRIFDDRLERMMLDDPRRQEALAQFLAASPRRRLHIVVHDPRHAETRCPRLRLLTGRFSNSIEIRESAAQLKHISDSYLLADECHGAIRFHRDHARGKLLLNAPDDVRPWWQRFDELWRSGAPCLAPTQVGL